MKKRRNQHVLRPNGYVLFFHAQLNLAFINFIMLINVKTSTIVGVLTFTIIINTTSESLKARHISFFQSFSFYEQVKLHARLLIV